jgi:Uma2 family endonuclease
MTAELARTHLITPEEYLDGEAMADVRHEYLNGLVYGMAGTSWRHNRIVSAMDRSLGNRLAGSPCEPVVLDVRVKVEFDDDIRFYYPDLYVVCEEGDDEVAAHTNPVMIVEVISESTRRTDEGEKLAGYLKLPSLQLYLLVETEMPLVVSHRRAGDIFTRQSYSGLDAIIPLPFLKTELPLAEIYERIVFKPPQT